MTIAILGLGNIGRTIAALLSPWKPHIIGVSRTARRCAHVRGIRDARGLARRTGGGPMPSSSRWPSTRRPTACSTRGNCRGARRAASSSISRAAASSTTHALADALTTGNIGGAGLDVTHPEPLPQDHPLWSAPNLIVTPHVAGGSARSVRADAGRDGRRQSQALSGRTAARQRRLVNGRRGRCAPLRQFLRSHTIWRTIFPSLVLASIIA